MKFPARRRVLNDVIKEAVSRGKIEKLIELQGKVRFSIDAKTLRRGWDRKLQRSK